MTVIAQITGINAAAHALQHSIAVVKVLVEMTTPSSNDEAAS